ncbi:MAG: hypothetical protein SO135_01645 [Sphaerochaetaceae bacterium]|jgi:3-deoxy-D-arabino-heptulosonate 7-phosphate (DAHP) synthase|nr:hypothetical protein [Sphaerochaetaceae bacterium]
MEKKKVDQEPKKVKQEVAVEPEVNEAVKKEVADVHQVLHAPDGRWAVKRKNSEKV